MTPDPLNCLRELMPVNVETSRPDSAIRPVVRQMHERHIHRVIVVDEENLPVGIVTSLDVLGELPVGWSREVRAFEPGICGDGDTRSKGARHEPSITY